MHFTGFQWYLVGVNIIAFVLYSVDYYTFQESGEQFEPQGLLNFATTFGGALGTLISFLIWDRKTNKVNLMSRVYTIVWLIIQVIFVLALYGPNKEQTKVWFFNFYESHKILCVYIGAINIITFIAFVVDKIKAMNGHWRIREVTLLGLSLIGGAVGGLIAMDLFNHKTSVRRYDYKTESVVSTTYFIVGLPLMIIVHLILILCFLIGIF